MIETWNIVRNYLFNYYFSKDPKQTVNQYGRFMALGIGLLVFFLFFAGIYYLGSFKDEYILKTEKAVVAISSVHADHIQKWYHQRQKEATLIQKSTQLRNLTHKLINSPNDKNVESEIIREIDLVRGFHHSDMFIFTADGETVFAYPSHATPIKSHIFFPYIEAKSNDIHWLDFYLNDQDNKFYLASLIPMKNHEGDTFAYWIVRINPALDLHEAFQLFNPQTLNVTSRFVFPYKDGLYAFSGEKPAEKESLFRAIDTGKESTLYKALFEDSSKLHKGIGSDGVEVYAVISRVANSNWHIITEIDSGQIFSSFRERFVVITVMASVFLLSLIAMGFVFARQQQLKLLRLNRDNELLLDDLINNQPSGIYRVVLHPEQIQQPFNVNDLTNIDTLPLEYIFVSKQHEIITGISEKFIFQNPKAIFNAIHPDDRTSFFQTNLESISQIKRFKWDGRLIVNGAIKWVSFDSVPRLNPPEQIIWTGVVIDVTAQKELELEMENREAFERLITRLSSSFVNISNVNADAIIQSALNAVGNFCGIDRSYIFLFIEDGEYASNVYEWCAEGIVPQKDDLQRLEMSLVPQWMKLLRKFKHIDIFDVNDLPGSWKMEKEILQPQGIRSLLVVPVYSTKNLYGFVGFDSVKKHRKWKDYEVQLLQVFADLLHNAFERQKSEASINEYQQMLRTVLDTIKVRVFWKDKDLKFRGCNAAFAKDSGINNPKEIIGKDDFQMTWQEQADRFRSEDIHVMSTGKPILNAEEPQRQADGSIKWISLTKVPLRNHAGDIIGVLGTYQDITSQKLYKDALEASEKRYRILTEKAFDGIYLLRKNVFEYVNQRFCDLTGFTFEELTNPGFDNLSLFTQESKDKALARKSARINGDDLPTTYEMEIITRSGEIRQVEISTNKLSDIGQENFILGIMRDVTERRNIEKLTSQVAIANQAAQFKQNFLANMSHEIRTPLTGVLGMIEVLSKTTLDTNQADYVNTLKHSTENLRVIINQILDYSKIEAGQVKLKNVVFETDELFRNAKKLFENTCQKDVDFVLEVSKNIPQYVKADQYRLSQVINNLVSNAIKFTNKGKINLRANVDEDLEKSYLIIRIEVEDTGIGIKKQAMDSLFKPFEQVDHIDKRHFEGTGLGLSICKELVTLMHGDIGVSSEEGKGSRFWFTFRARRTEKKVGNRLNVDKLSNTPGRSLNILFAEDKIVNQKVVSLLLKALGHTVTLAANGIEALEVYKQGKFDLILMDIQMPEMDGITATRMLKEKYNNLPPIVGLSANAFEGDREKYMSQGLDEYITKPIKGEELKAIIEKLKIN